jgi:hypothetical protein
MYTTAAPYAAIRAHYDRVTKQHGWSIVCEQPVRDWGRDFGGKIREYRKGPYRASLQYAGNDTTYGWTYTFDVTWQLGTDCG